MSLAEKVVTIVIPVYNDARFVGRAIEAAMNQTYPNTEIIVVDDGSDVETKKVLERYSNTVTVHTQENQGQSAARNNGVHLSNGDYILNLDSDDYFAPTFLEKAVPILNDFSVKAVGCHINIVDEEGGFLQKSNYTAASLKETLFRNSLTGSLLFRKKDFLAIGGYDVAMRSGYEDWEFLIRLLKNGGRTHVIDEVLFTYTRKNVSTTTFANSNEHNLWHYIHTKHEDVYTQEYTGLLEFYKSKLIQKKELSSALNTSREMILGNALLKPFRYLKRKVYFLTNTKK